MEGWEKRGIGYYIHADGAIEYGNWHDDKNFEHCLMYLSNGDRFEGAYQHGQKNRFGICIWNNLSVYAGHWKDDMKHGNGIQRSSDGNIYSGEWQQNEET